MTTSDRLVVHRERDGTLRVLRGHAVPGRFSKSELGPNEDPLGARRESADELGYALSTGRRLRRASTEVGGAPAIPVNTGVAARATHRDRSALLRVVDADGVVDPRGHPVVAQTCCDVRGVQPDRDDRALRSGGGPQTPIGVVAATAACRRGARRRWLNNRLPVFLRAAPIDRCVWSVSRITAL